MNTDSKQSSSIKFVPTSCSFCHVQQCLTIAEDMQGHFLLHSFHRTGSLRQQPYRSFVCGNLLQLLSTHSQLCSHPVGLIFTDNDLDSFRVTFLLFFSSQGWKYSFICLKNISIADQEPTTACLAPSLGRLSVISINVYSEFKFCEEFSNNWG